MLRLLAVLDFSRNFESLASGGGDGGRVVGGGGGGGSALGSGCGGGSLFSFAQPWSVVCCWARALQSLSLFWFQLLSLFWFQLLSLFWFQLSLPPCWSLDLS